MFFFLFYQLTCSVDLDVGMTEIQIKHPERGDLNPDLKLLNDTKNSKSQIFIVHAMWRIFPDRITIGKRKTNWFYLTNCMQRHVKNLHFHFLAAPSHKCVLFLFLIIIIFYLCALCFYYYYQRIPTLNKISKII